MGAIKNEKTDTQCKRIVQYMKKNHFITSRDAFRHLGVASLHRRLSDLRESGYIFGNEFVKDESGLRWKRYWIVSEPGGVAYE